jgi:diacylglycerol kinase family enzyme
VKAILLINERAGRAGHLAAAQINRLLADLTEAGVTAEFRVTPADQLTAAAATAARTGADAVVAAGGDGTISAVAAALVGGHVPLGVIPLGTLNHFAKDLHIPLQMQAAARVLAAGHVQRIDVGEVNGRIFVNNSSIGIYPSMVRERDDQRARWRRKKWFAMGIAAVRALRELPLLDVRLEIAGGTLQRKTPLVFVGNNRYEFSLPALGARHVLDAGELSVHVANCTTRWRIVRLAMRGLMGRLRPTADFDVLYTAQLWVDTPRSHLTVALDGEIMHLAPPLAYCTRPAALRVLTPSPRPLSHVQIS